MNFIVLERTNQVYLTACLIARWRMLTRNLIENVFIKICLCNMEILEGISIYVRAVCLRMSSSSSVHIK